jgi:hypothetical protein
MQHPPTTHLSDLHQQAVNRVVYDNPPAIESSRGRLLQVLLRLRGGAGSTHIASMSSTTSAPSRTR